MHPCGYFWMTFMLLVSVGGIGGSIFGILESRQQATLNQQRTTQCENENYMLNQQCELFSTAGDKYNIYYVYKCSGLNHNILTNCTLSITEIYQPGTLIYVNGGECRRWCEAGVLDGEDTLEGSVVGLVISLILFSSLLVSIAAWCHTNKN
jgi:hypothetical protein